MLDDPFSGTSLEDDLVNFAPAVPAGDGLATPQTPHPGVAYDGDVADTPRTPSYAAPRPAGGLDSKSVLDAQEAAYYDQQRQLQQYVASVLFFLWPLDDPRP